MRSVLTLLGVVLGAAAGGVLGLFAYFLDLRHKHESCGTFGGLFHACTGPTHRMPFVVVGLLVGGLFGVVAMLSRRSEL